MKPKCRIKIRWIEDVHDVLLASEMLRFSKSESVPSISSRSHAESPSLSEIKLHWSLAATTGYLDTTGFLMFKLCTRVSQSKSGAKLAMSWFNSLIPLPQSPHTPHELEGTILFHGAASCQPRTPDRGSSTWFNSGSFRRHL